METFSASLAIYEGNPLDSLTKGQEPPLPKQTVDKRLKWKYGDFTPHDAQRPLLFTWFNFDLSNDK